MIWFRPWSHAPSSQSPQKSVLRGPPTTSFDLTDVRYALSPQETFWRASALIATQIVIWIAIFLGPWHLLLASILLTPLRLRRSSMQRLITGSSVPVSSTYSTRLKTLNVTCFHGCFKSVLEALEHLLVSKSLQQAPLLEKLILDGMEFFDPMTGDRFGSPTVMLMDVPWM